MAELKKELRLWDVFALSAGAMISSGLFVLVESRDERNYHLRALMAIAQIAQKKDFRTQWMQARDTEGLRNDSTR